MRRDFLLLERHSESGDLLVHRGAIHGGRQLVLLPVRSIKRRVMLIQSYIVQHRGESAGDGVVVELQSGRTNVSVFLVDRSRVQHRLHGWAADVWPPPACRLTSI